MLTTTNWSFEIFKQCQDIRGCVYIPFKIGQWLFVSCILVGFLLVSDLIHVSSKVPDRLQLAYESRKARKIILSRDISYAFTNVVANNYYSLRRFIHLCHSTPPNILASTGSYDHFCFFDHISNSTKTSDDFAFFVFFTFKSRRLSYILLWLHLTSLAGWKRLLLADAPRQAINALTLYAVYLVKKDNPGSWYDVRKYFKDNSNSTSALMISSFFTVAVCVGSLLLLIIAAICYVPLLIHIRGNLKEYCCHKVDKVGVPLVKFMPFII